MTPVLPVVSGRARRRAVLALALGETLVWAGLYYAFAALLPVWEGAEGWPKTKLTLGFTLAVLTAAALAPLAGRLIDAGYGRSLLTFGALAGAAALVGLSQVQEPGGFVAVWMLIGAAQACCLYEPCFAFVTRTAGRNARPAIVRITLAAGFASTLAFPGFAALAGGFGWRIALLAGAGVIALVAAPLLNIGAGLLAASSDDPPPPLNRGENRAALRRAFRQRAFWLIALAMALMGFNHAILIAHILPIMADRGASPGMAVAAASLIGPSQVAGRLLLMRYEAHITPASAAFWTMAIAVLASILLLAAGVSAMLIFAFAVTQGGAIGVVSILRPVLMLDHLGRTAFGAISGRAAVIYLVSAAAAPFLGALLWQAGGYALVIATSLACALAALALAVLLRAQGKQPA